MDILFENSTEACQSFIDIVRAENSKLPNAIPLQVFENDCISFQVQNTIIEVYFSKKQIRITSACNMKQSAMKLARAIEQKYKAFVKYTK